MPNREEEIEYNPFDPLSYDSLRDSLTKAFDACEVHQLGNVEGFKGAGIYALYYTGDLPFYARIADKNRENPGTCPIYVGRASAAKGRKGSAISDQFIVKNQLYDRITKHADSIKLVRNLDISDFQVRTLVVVPAWISLAEVVSLGKYKTVWNDELDGFGNNPTGKPREGQTCSKWDTVHPGRPYAGKTPRNESQDDLIARVVRYADEYVV